MAVFSELQSSLSLDSSDFKKGLKSASGAATSFSKTTSSAFDSVDDEASGAQRAIGRVSDAMSSLGRSSAAVVVPVNRAAGAIDDAGDEASGTTRSFAALSMTTSGLSASFGILTASATSAAGAIGLIAVALSPLLPVIATAAGAFGAIAAIFGVIVGSGVAAWFKQTGTTMKEVTKTIQNLVTSFGQQFVPLIKDAISLLPSFIKRISNAVGSLDPFVKALRVLGTIAYRVIPPLIGVFADLAKTALPFFVDAAKWIGKRIVPALKALFAAGQRAAGEVYRLAKGFFRVAKSLTGVAGWVGRFVVALYDLAAAALGVGKLTKELRRVGQVIKGGLKGAFQWLSTTGVKLARQAFKTVSDAAMSAFKFTKQELTPAISTGLGKAWQWVRTKGVTKAKSALGFLSDKALAAFEFTKTEIVPRVKKGLQKAWKWLRTKGATRTKNALKFLADKAAKGFQWTRKELVPKARSAISGLSKWLRTKGKTKLKKALDVMARLATKGWNFGQKHLLKPIQKGIRKTVQWIKTKGWTAFKAAFRGWGQSIGKFALAWIRTIRDTFAKGIPKLRNWLSNNGVRLIKQAFFNIGRGIRNAILAIFTAGGIVFQALVSAWTGLVNWLKSGGAKKIKNAFIDIFTGIANYITTQAATDIKNAFQFVIDAAWAVINGFVKGLTTKTIPQLGSDIVKGIKNWNIKSTFDSILHDAWVELSLFASNALQTIKGGFGNIIDYFQNQFLTDIKNALRNAAKQAIQAFKAKFNAMMPDKIGIPSVTIAGHHVGGGSIDLPSLAVGGTIQSDGLFYGHAGETIVPADASTPYSGGDSGGGTQDVTVTLDVRGDSELARMIERHIEANEQDKARSIDRVRSSFGDT